MNANKVGIGIVTTGALCMGGGVLDHGGIGSCGPFGAGGPFILPGLFLVPLGLLVLAMYWAYRAVMHSQH